MRIQHLLVHRCDIEGGASGGEKEIIGRDPYGRPIYGDPDGSATNEGVPCRLDQLRERVAPDATGRDVVITNMLILGPEVKPTYDMTVTNIRDKQGNQLVDGVFRVDSILPSYNMQDLHHYEVTLAREGG